MTPNDYEDLTNSLAKNEDVRKILTESILQKRAIMNLVLQ